MYRRFKPRYHQSSVTVPRKQRLSWHISTAILQSLFLATILLGFIWLMVAVGGGLKSKIFFPIRLVHTEQELAFGDKQDIIDIINNYPYKDLLYADISVFKKEMEHLSWVKSVKVYKSWPDTIMLRLTERVPVVRWGKQEFLDNEGNRFKVPMTPELARLFPLQGPDSYEIQVLALYQKIAPWLKSEGIAAERLVLDSRLVWHIRLADDVDVIIGRDNLNERLKKLAVVNKRIILPYQKYIEAVDLRYQNGFSVRWKQGVLPDGATAGAEVKH